MQRRSRIESLIGKYGTKWETLIKGSCRSRVARIGAVSVKLEIDPGFSGEPANIQNPTLCLPQIRSVAGSRHAKPETRYFDRCFGPKQMDGAREIHGEIGDQEEVWLVPVKQNQLGSKSRNWARTAAIRLRVARSGGEARQLAVRQLRVPRSGECMGRGSGGSFASDKCVRDS